MIALNSSVVNVQHALPDYQRHRTIWGHLKGSDMFQAIQLIKNCSVTSRPALSKRFLTNAKTMNTYVGEN